MGIDMNTDARDEARGNATLAIVLALIVLVWGVNGIYLAWLSGVSAAAFWLADVMQWLVLPLGCLLLLSERHGVTPADYGFARPTQPLRELVLGAVAAATFYPAFFWVRDASAALLGNPGGFFALQDVFPDGALGTLVWLYSAFTAGFIESILFIGLPWLLWSRLREGGRVPFTLLCSLVFALVHWEQGPHVVAGALAFSLVACAWFFRVHSLWPVAIGHTVVDLIAFG